MINRPIINQIQELDIPKKYFQGLTIFSKPDKFLPVDFWRLEPREFLGSYYMLCDFTQGHGQIVHDYLKEE